jgi:broad specificity phosphatase PhoE
MLVLVRHAMPDHGPDTPAHTWPLTAEGRDAAAGLCRGLPAGAWLVASSETKAIETLAPAGPALPDPRFDEVRRTEAYADDFRTARRAYTDGTDHPGWEPRTDVVRRFSAGVAEHVERAGGRLVVVATHGMAMTVWLTATTGLGDPGAFWAGLELPDAFVVDLAERSVERLRSG